ncbi:MAG: hypothetical protein Q4P78_05080 [Rothia sp. (in: high G+C Gram-positive bacteria)]|uniref:hypothetical protein n=1 Tax=Rothia sp. (in: high G+C Gram-positive bacteria) TaxID=1885016 RepID=UPI0026E0935C|nr:hypothetical protein [Rothia sp. (in: high G+C Gram-positive bacteria)]MDO5750559.1 hypothetical protein [Rothia sp. (in: high G+C Gram-positive bacteria)]
MVDHQAVQKVDELTDYPEALRLAWQKGLKDCMAKKGFTPQGEYYMPYNATVRSTLPPGELTIEEARQYGYSNPAAQAQKAKEQQSTITEEEIRALRGYGEENQNNSCEYIVSIKIFGDIDLADTLFTADKHLLPYAEAAGMSDELIHIYMDWAQCMKDKYQLPYKAPDEIFYTYRAAEIPANIPVADATCREQVNYEDRVMELLNAYMTSFLEDNQALIERITQAKKNAEENAPKILDGTL